MLESGYKRSELVYKCNNLTLSEWQGQPQEICGTKLGNCTEGCQYCTVCSTDGVVNMPVLEAQAKGLIL